MKDKGKFIKNLLIFVLLIILTFYILLKDQNILEIFSIISSIKIQYILVGILCMAIYIILEAVNIGRTLKALNEKSNFLSNIKYALIGFFFSAITPAASGGQPMQIYYMYKDNISISNSTLALLLNLLSMQISTIGIALVSLIFNYGYLNNFLIACFALGVFLNSTALILLLIAIFSKRMSAGLINIAIKVLRFLRIKNIEQKKEKFEYELKQYQENAVFVRNNVRLILKTLVTTLIQFLIYYSITYWVYLSFGFTEHNILQLISMQSVLYATVSGIPSPGAVGVSEGAFMQIFRQIYPETTIALNCCRSGHLS